jgi:hypothetical protein
MHTCDRRTTWQHVFGWLIFFMIASTAIISLAPANVEARSAGQALPHSRLQSALSLLDTPALDSPVLSLFPGSGPVGTLVTLTGTGWPPGSQVVISYDDVSTCDNSNLQELSPDPKPTIDTSGNFSATFPWPSISSPVPATWYACVSTSDSSATGSTPFLVLALNPPAISISAKGPFMPGQTIKAQGQNWMPGGLLIAFALQSIDTKISYPLEGSATSLTNGTFVPFSFTLPAYLSPGSYVLVASTEQEALQAQSSVFTLRDTPTPTPTPTPSPTPAPPITPTPMPVIPHHQTPPPQQLSGALLALVITSGGMALVFALAGAALLTYLLRSRPVSPAVTAQHSETEQLRTKP